MLTTREPSLASLKVVGMAGKLPRQPAHKQPRVDGSNWPAAKVRLDIPSDGDAAHSVQRITKC